MTDREILELLKGRDKLEIQLRTKLILAQSEIISLRNTVANLNRRMGIQEPMPAEKRKIRFEGMTLTKKTQEVFDLCGGKCFYCDFELNPQTVTCDHLIPCSRGGTSNIRNLVPACSWCNNRKGSRMPTKEETGRAKGLHDAREQARAKSGREENI